MQSGRFFVRMPKHDVSYRYPVIAREGWSFIALTAALALFANHYFGPLWGSILAALTLVLVLLFRDPSRRIPASPLSLISPVDGKVIAIDELHDPWLNRKAVRIALSVSRLGVFSVRSPLEGKVAQQWYPSSEAPSVEGKRCYAQWIQGDEEDDVVMAIYVNVLNRRPFCYLHAGERVGQGQRCGYIPFGTRLDLFVPLESRITVKPGSRVHSGTDSLATLIRR